MVEVAFCSRSGIIKLEVIEHLKVSVEHHLVGLRVSGGIEGIEHKLIRIGAVKSTAILKFVTFFPSDWIWVQWTLLQMFY